MPCVKKVSFGWEREREEAFTFCLPSEQIKKPSHSSSNIFHPSHINEATKHNKFSKRLFKIKWHVQTWVISNTNCPPKSVFLRLLGIFS